MVRSPPKRIIEVFPIFFGSDWSSGPDIRDIGPDGALAREVKRGNHALHYHTFALIPLVFAAELARRRNIDLYRESGGAIGRPANPVIDIVEKLQVSRRSRRSNRISFRGL
ncbi:alginate lyase family protein [Burkholderia singularis]|uniref:alginate lyase family protein n=1 Tax=Burkholderia singularis TaxID=1503053 RepID=UPI000A4D8EA7|nr:alginate lyase family protein [Burkholderia singularis]